MKIYCVVASWSWRVSAMLPAVKGPLSETVVRAKVIMQKEAIFQIALMIQKFAPFWALWIPYLVHGRRGRLEA